MTPEPRRTGRKSKLTPQVIRKVAAALRAGCFFKVACEYAGISESTGHLWLQIARGDRPEQRPTALQSEFLDAVKKADADAEVAAVTRIMQAAIGELLISRVTRTVTRRREDGTVIGVTQTVKETFMLPQWKAAAWLLERRFSERWARTVRIRADQPAPRESQDQADGIVIIYPMGSDRGDRPGAEATTEGRSACPEKQTA